MTENKPKLTIFNLTMLCLKNYKSFDDYGYELERFNQEELIAIIKIVMQSHKEIDIDNVTLKEQIETLENVLIENDIEY